MTKISEDVSLLIDSDRDQNEYNHKSVSQAQSNQIKVSHKTNTFEDLELEPELNKDERRQRRLNSELLLAIEIDDEEQFQKILQKGASINSVCRNGKLSACHAAVLFERCEFLKELLERGANLTPADNGCTPLHLAALKGSLECLKIFITHDPSIISTPVQINEGSKSKINSRDLDSWDFQHDLDVAEIQFIAEGSTALHLACRQLHVDCIEYLLDQDADIEAQDSYGRVPIDMIFRTVEIIHKSNVNDETYSIKRSIKSICSSEETIEEFDSTVTSISSVNYEKLAELIVFFLVNYAASNKVAESVDDKDDDIDWRDTHMLSTAVIIQSPKLISFLLNKKVDVNAAIVSADTPLQLAVRFKLRDSLDTLLEFDKIKDSLETKDNQGRTALLIAVHVGWNYGINVLLEAGANVAAITDTGNNILHLIARTNNVTAMREILTFQESRKIMNFKNLQGETPLMVAVSEGSIKCVQALLLVGADYQLMDENLRTIAHIAAECGHVETLDLILSHDLNLLNKKTKFGETALHLATFEGRVDCVKLLLRRGSSTKIECSPTNRKFFESVSSLNQNLTFSGTPLHYAAMDGKYEVLKCLCDYDSALVNVINNSGCCPLHAAIYFNQFECARYLIEHGANLSNTMTYFDGPTVSAINVICSKFPDPTTFLLSIWNSNVHVHNKQTKTTSKSILMDFGVLSPSFNHTREIEVLATIAHSENIQLRDTILNHPLTRAFLNFKQKKVAATFLYFALIVQCLFAISITIFGIAAMNPNSSEISVRISLSVMSAILFFLCANEIYLFLQLRETRTTNFNIWLKWGSYMMALIISLHSSYTLFKNTWRQDLLWTYLLPFPITLSWVQFSSLLLLVPKFSYYVIVFRRTFLITFEAIACVFLTALSISLVNIVITGKFPTIEHMLIASDIEKLFSAFTTLDYFHKSSIFQMSGFEHFFSIICSFCFTIFFISYVITILIVVIRNIRRVNRTSLVVKEIEFLSSLQLYIYDEKILKCLPRKLKKKIINGRHVPRSLEISQEQYNLFMSDDLFTF